MIDESERARFAESARAGEMIDELTRERDAEVARLNAEIARLTGELRHGATVRGRPGTMSAGVLGWIKDSDPFWDVISEGRCVCRCFKSHVLDDWEVINPAQYIEQLTRDRDEAKNKQAAREAEWTVLHERRGEHLARANRRAEALERSLAEMTRWRDEALKMAQELETRNKVLARERDEAIGAVARLTREALENDVVGAETALHFCRGMSEEADAQKALNDARARLAAFNRGESE